MNSYDLLSYKEARIDALQREVLKKEQRLNKLETFIFELIDKDCPEEYKTVIRSEVFADGKD